MSAALVRFSFVPN